MNVAKYKNSSKTNLIIFFISFVLVFVVSSYNVTAFCIWPFCTSNDHAPKVFLDVADCNNIAGWACDEDKYATPLTVSFSLYEINNNPSPNPEPSPEPDIPTANVIGKSNQITGYVVSIPSQYAVKSRSGLPCGGYSNHGFDFSTPSGINDGKKYTIQATANNIDQDGDSDGSPAYSGTKTIGPCPSSPPSQDTIDISTIGTYKVTVAVNEEKNFPIIGGIPPYRINDDPSGNGLCKENGVTYATCEVRQSGSNYVLYIKGLTLTESLPSHLTWTYVKDKSTPNNKAKAIDVNITYASAGGCTGTKPCTEATCVNGQWQGCGSLTGLCNPLAPSPCSGNFGGTSTISNSPADYTTEQARAWRIAQCIPLGNGHSTLVDFVNKYKVAWPDTTLIPFSGTTSDKVKFPTNGWIDLINGGPPECWKFAKVEDLCKDDSECLTSTGSRCTEKTSSGENAWCSCTSNSNCKSGMICDPTYKRCGFPGSIIPCSPDYRGQMQGWDLSRIGDDTRYSPTYDAAWQAQCMDPGSQGVLQNLLNKLRTDGKITKCDPSTISLDSEGNIQMCADEADAYVGIRGSGLGSYWLRGFYAGNPTPSDCNDPTGAVPVISQVIPTTATKNTKIKIKGNDLTRTVKFYSGTNEYAAVGNVNQDCTETTITIPNELSAGKYTLKSRKAADKLSNGVDITIKGNVRKCNPDGDVCDYCDEESQCLVNPLATDNPCIKSGEYSDDNYCDNGEWSSRTKLLALKLLKIKNGDYTLFCDTKENTLNNLQYLTDSGQAASSVLTSIQSNNFCILKTADKIIVAGSFNKDPENVLGIFSLFGVTKCDAARDDGNYYQCDSSKSVWYNKKLKSFIYSAAPFAMPQDQEPSSALSGLIRPIIDAIKRLISTPPYDESYVQGIKKFYKIYLSQQGSKSIMGALEGKNLKNAVIQYNSFDVDVCGYTNQYNSQKGLTLAGIACKKDGNNYYVLAQGNQMTNLDPETIWPDLTAKIRLK